MSTNLDILSTQQQAELAWSAEQAQRQMDFQERMSNTAHQREIEDLKKAGLNPILSASGQGAETPSGAKGEMSTILPQLMEVLQMNAKSVSMMANAVSKSSGEDKQEGFGAVAGLLAGISALNDAMNLEKSYQDAKSELMDSLNGIRFNFRGGRAGLSASISSIIKAFEEAKKFYPVYTKRNAKSILSYYGEPLQPNLKSRGSTNKKSLSSKIKTYAKNSAKNYYDYSRNNDYGFIW